MRQEGVRVASGRRQDNLASGWRQDDVKRRGARINWTSAYNGKPPSTYLLSCTHIHALRRSTFSSTPSFYWPPSSFYWNFWYPPYWNYKSYWVQSGY